METQKFRKLKTWNKAMDFIEDVYRFAKVFPNDETYGLVSQIRRASVSIALNISEGSGSGSDKEFIRFLTISLRSSYEVNCALEIAKRLKYGQINKVKELTDKCNEISAMLTGLIHSLKCR